MDPKLLASGSDDAKGTVKSKLFFLYIFNVPVKKSKFSLYQQLW